MPMADIFNLIVNFDSMDFNIRKSTIEKNKYSQQVNAGALMHQYCSYIVDRIFEISQELVPVDTGELYESGQVIKDIGDYGVVYTAPHASYVHEIIEYNHNYPSRAKFLEDAALFVYFELVDSGVNNPFTFTVSAVYGSNLILRLNSVSQEVFTSNMVEILNAKVENRRQDKSKLVDILTDWGL